MQSQQCYSNKWAYQWQSVTFAWLCQEHTTNWSLVLSTAAIPAVLEDQTGDLCLVILPSDRPSSRREASAVAELLADMIHDPASAAQKACQWRANTLATHCSDSLASLAQTSKAKGLTAWQFKQCSKPATGEHGVQVAMGTQTKSAGHVWLLHNLHYSAEGVPVAVHRCQQQSTRGCQDRSRCKLLIRDC